MFSFVWIQSIIIFILTLFCWLVFGFNGAEPVFLGGASYIASTLLSVLVWILLRRKSGAAFFVAEGLKILQALLWLFIAAYYYQPSQFLFYMLGLFVASHCALLFSLRVFWNVR